MNSCQSFEMGTQLITIDSGDSQFKLCDVVEDIEFLNSN